MGGGSSDEDVGYMSDAEASSSSSSRSSRRGGASDLTRSFNLLDKVLAAACKIIDPTLGEQLLKLYLRDRGEGDFGLFFENARKLIQSTPRESTEQRAIWALLASSMGNNLLEQQRVPRRSHAGSSKRLAARGRVDWKSITEGGGQIRKPKIGRQRVSAALVRDLVEHIVGCSTRVSWRWVTHIWRDDYTGEEEETIVPALFSRFDCATCWLRYHEERPERGARVGNSAFRRVFLTLTRGKEKSLRALDYFLTDLLLEMKERIIAVVRDVAPESEERKRILTNVELVYNHAQHSYAHHLDGKSSCPCHDPLFSLGHPDHKSAGGSCASCAAMVRFFTAALPTSLGGVLAPYSQLIGDAFEKLKLYMGHTVRAHGQNKRIDELKTTATIERIHIIIDWMMKFEDSRHREASRDHYGKRGQSVHGAFVVFFNVDGSAWCRYFHCAVQGDSKQDVGSTLSVLEVLLINIRNLVELQATKFMSLQSDNAANYSSLFFVLFAFELARKYGFEITSFIHNEAQDGKDLVDVSFAALKRAWKKWVRESRKRIVTPSDMITASKYGRGIKDSHLDVAILDRPKLAEIEAKFAEVEGRMSQALPSNIAEVRRNADGSYSIHESSPLPPYSFDGFAKKVSGSVKKVDTYMQANPLQMTLAFFRGLVAATAPGGGGAAAGAAAADADAAGLPFTGVRVVDSVPPPERGGATARLQARRRHSRTIGSCPKWKQPVAATEGADATTTSAREASTPPQQEVGSSESSDDKSPSDSSSDDDSPSSGAPSSSSSSSSDSEDERPAAAASSSSSSAGSGGGSGGGGAPPSPLPMCPCCRKTFSDQKKLSLHEKKASCTERKAKMGVQVQAVRELKKQVEAGESGVVIGERGGIAHVAPAAAAAAAAGGGGDDDAALLAVNFPAGWARKPKHGEGKGRQYMTDDHRALFQELFMKGEENSGEKMSAALMLEELKKQTLAKQNGKFLSHFLPGLSEVAPYISQMATQRKNGKELGVGGRGGGRRKTKIAGKFKAAVRDCWANEIRDVESTMGVLQVEFEGEELPTMAAVRRYIEKLNATDGAESSSSGGSSSDSPSSSSGSSDGT